MVFPSFPMDYTMGITWFSIVHRPDKLPIDLAVELERARRRSFVLSDPGRRPGDGAYGFV